MTVQTRIAVQTTRCIPTVATTKILTGKMSRRIVAIAGFSLLIQWPRCWTQLCKVGCFQENTYSTSLFLAHLNMFRMTIRRERGPGGFNAGKDKRTHTSRKRIDFSRFGIPLPSKRRVRRNKPGFTAASGIIRNLLMSILRIAGSQNARCYVNSSNIKAIVISLTRDGLGLKPSVEIMQSRRKLKRSIDNQTYALEREP